MLHGSMIPRSVRRTFDHRSEPREPASEGTAVLELRGRNHVVPIVNTSPCGAMVILPLMPHIGEQVVLHLTGRGQVPGYVRWVRDGRVGVNFAAPLE